MPQKLKAERVLRGLNQEDVAKYLGIALMSYVYKENGQRDFNLTEIKKLLELFDKKFEDIF